MMLRLVALCAVIGAVHCGILDDVKGAASDVGDFFSNKFNDVKSLFANDEAELEKNVQRVKDLLATIQSKIGTLKPLATDAQKAVLDKVGDMSNQVNDFQQKLKSDTNKTFEEKSTEWKELATKIFQSEGLQQVIALVNGKSTGTNNGVSAIVASALCLVAPMAITLRH